MTTEPTGEAVPATERADHPWQGDEDGHNCAVCVERDDTLRMCWRENHPDVKPASRTDDRYQTFIRNVLKALASPQMPNDMTPEERVRAAQSVTDLFLNSDEPFDLTDEMAMFVAAVIATTLGDSPPPRDDTREPAKSTHSGRDETVPNGGAESTEKKD